MKAYTYLIGWKKHNLWYYGVRYGRDSDPSDLWKTYFTSSKEVQKYRKLCGEPDVVTIRKTFDDPNKARIWEDRVHRKMNVVKDKKWLNKSYGNKRFGSTFNKMCAVDKATGEILHIDLEDERLKTGEVYPISKNKVTVRDVEGNYLQVEKDDYRYTSGKLKHIATGTRLVIDDVSGVLKRIGINEDSTLETYSHFSNKVSTIDGMVEKDDYRKNKNNFSHINSGNTPAKCTKSGKSLGRIPNDDPRWLSGEIVALGKGSMAAKCSKTGKSIGNIPQSDPRWATGDIIAISKGTIMAKCSNTGKSVGRVSKDDPRWKDGSIVGIRKRL